MRVTTKNKLTPSLVVPALQEIDLHRLWDKGKRGIILDLDNTIVHWERNDLTGPAQAFIENALRLGYKICLISNASRSRTRKIAEHYGIPFVAPAFKPLKRPFLLAMKHLELNRDQVVMVGDQLFTDVWGGNRANFFTILVPPLDRREFIWTRFMRIAEKLAGRKG